MHHVSKLTQSLEAIDAATSEHSHNRSERVDKFRKFVRKIDSHSKSAAITRSENGCELIMALAVHKEKELLLTAV